LRGRRLGAQGSGGWSSFGEGLCFFFRRRTHSCALPSQFFVLFFLGALPELLVSPPTPPPSAPSLFPSSPFPFFSRTKLCCSSIFPVREGFSEALFAFPAAVKKMLLRNVFCTLHAFPVTARVPFLSGPDVDNSFFFERLAGFHRPGNSAFFGAKIPVFVPPNTPASVGNSSGLPASPRLAAPLQLFPFRACATPPISKAQPHSAVALF